jgi:hypothetical protein
MHFGMQFGISWMRLENKVMTGRHKMTNLNTEFESDPHPSPSILTQSHTERIPMRVVSTAVVDGSQARLATSNVNRFYHIWTIHHI